MSIIETFTKIIRGKTKTENVRTADYVIGDFPFSTPDAISAESAMRISTVYSCIRVRAEHQSKSRIYSYAPTALI